MLQLLVSKQYLIEALIGIKRFLKVAVYTKRKKATQKGRNHVRGYLHLVRSVSPMMLFTITVI